MSSPNDDGIDAQTFTEPIEPTQSAGLTEKQEKQERRKSYNPVLAQPVTSFDEESYPTDREKAAAALIFNFKEFEEIEKYPTRNGTEKDVEKLKEVFAKCNIDLSDDRILTNRSQQQVWNDTKTFTKDKKLMNTCNAIIVVILSHGLEDDNIMAKDGAFHLYEYMKLFTPDELPEMVTRPKIFLIQACRGSGIDNGSLVMPLTLMDHVDSAVNAEPVRIIKYPNFADIIIGLSAHHGHYSYRSDEGSWYIQDFCNVLQVTDLEKEDFINVLVKTNKQVAKRNSRSENVTFDDKKQTSSFYCTLTKRLFLKIKE